MHLADATCLCSAASALRLRPHVTRSVCRAQTAATSAAITRVSQQQLLPSFHRAGILNADYGIGLNGTHFCTLSDIQLGTTFRRDTHSNGANSRLCDRQSSCLGCATNSRWYVDCLLDEMCCAVLPWTAICRAVQQCKNLVCRFDGPFNPWLGIRSGCHNGLHNEGCSGHHGLDVSYGRWDIRAHHHTVPHPLSPTCTLPERLYSAATLQLLKHTDYIKFVQYLWFLL